MYARVLLLLLLLVIHVCAATFVSSLTHDNTTANTTVNPPKEPHRVSDEIEEAFHAETQEAERMAASENVAEARLREVLAERTLEEARRESAMMQGDRTDQTQRQLQARIGSLNQQLQAHERVLEREKQQAEAMTRLLAERKGQADATATRLQQLKNQGDLAKAHMDSELMAARGEETRLNRAERTASTTLNRLEARTRIVDPKQMDDRERRLQDMMHRADAKEAELRAEETRLEMELAGARRERSTVEQMERDLALRELERVQGNLHESHSTNAASSPHLSVLCLCVVMGVVYRILLHSY